MPGPETNPHRILLTGSSGVLGFHVLAQLAARGEREILTLARTHTDLVAPDTFRHQVVDFKNRGQLSSVFQDFRPTCVIHCAGSGMIFPSVEWFELIRFNVDATLALFEQAVERPGCHFIHVSTGLAYRETGRPLHELDALENIHPYGASKAAADLLLRSAAHEFAAPLTLFRPFSFTGLNDSRNRLFPSILRAAGEKTPALLSPGDQVRDFCSARDIAHGIVRSVDRPPPPGSPAVYNLGSGRSLALREVVEQVVESLQIPVTLKFGAKGYHPTEPMHLVADTTRARGELGWTPRHQLAHAVWELAAASYPALRLREPEEFLPPS